MAAMSAKGEYVHNSDEAEVLACRKALAFAMEAGFSDLIIEGDNSNFMRALSASAVNNSLYGHVVDDIRSYFLGWQFVGLSCVKKEGNMVAHSLARFARNIVDVLYWMEDEPPPAVDALHFDRLHINE